MSETTHDLTQRAEQAQRLMRIYRDMGTVQSVLQRLGEPTRDERNQIARLGEWREDLLAVENEMARLSAALVQAEQMCNSLMTKDRATVEHGNVLVGAMRERAEAAEAKLVQAEQEKAALLEKLEIGERIEIDLADRLASQEATIRQVVQAMRTVATDFPTTVSASDLLHYAGMIEALFPPKGDAHADPLVVEGVPDSGPGQRR